MAGIVPTTKKETFESTLDLIDWNRKYNQEFLASFIKMNEYKEKIIQVGDIESILEYLVE